MIVTESSDLGRKGRAGATVVIFTAGMDDLRGQFFSFENDCKCAILTIQRFKVSVGDKKVRNRNNLEVPYSTRRSLNRKSEAELLIRTDVIDNHVLWRVCVCGIVKASSVPVEHH